MLVMLDVNLVTCNNLSVLEKLGVAVIIFIHFLYLEYVIEKSRTNLNVTLFLLPYHGWGF